MTDSPYPTITHSDKITQGTQDFDRIIETNSIYVDKTPYISHWVLTGTGRTNLMHRPRRFGKTLTFSVIKEIYRKNKVLFKNTKLTEEFWDKIQPRSVISLSFAVISDRHPLEELEYRIKGTMLEQMEDYGILKESDGALTGAQLFNEAITRLVRKDPENRPVILIDEYDALLISAYERGTSLKEAANILAEYISPLKHKSASIYAAYVIGIMKCQGLKLMSAVNNPTDKSFAPEYAQMIGITMEEIQEHFTPELEKLQKKFSLSMEELLHKIKINYNGYSFSHECLEKTVYAGYSLCTFMAEASEFLTYWYSTGSINIVYSRSKDQLDRIKTLIDQGEILGSLTDLKLGQSTVNESRIELTTLLFYHGYLTFKAKSDGNQCTFGFPNDEVKKSFSKNYAEYFFKFSQAALTEGVEELKKHIQACQVNELMILFFQLIAIIPGILHTYAEKYYQTVILTSLSIAYGGAVRAEQPVAGGIPDLVLDLPNLVYIFEFKYVPSHVGEAPLFTALENAEKQILSKQYFGPYGKNKKLLSIAIVISGEKNNIAGYKVVQELMNGVPNSDQTESKPVLLTWDKIETKWTPTPVEIKQFLASEEVPNQPADVTPTQKENKNELEAKEKEILELQNKILLSEALARAEKAEADVFAAEVDALAAKVKAKSDALVAKAQAEAEARAAQAQAQADALVAKAQAEAEARAAQADALIAQAQADALAAKAQAQADALAAKAQAEGDAEAKKLKLILRLKGKGSSTADICNIMEMSKEEWKELTGEDIELE